MALVIPDTGLLPLLILIGGRTFSRVSLLLRHSIHKFLLVLSYIVIFDVVHSTRRFFLYIDLLQREAKWFVRGIAAKFGNEISFGYFLLLA